MPEFSQTIPEIRESVIRPVVYAVIEDIMAVTGIDRKRTYIEIKSPYGTIQVPGSDYQNTHPDKLNVDDKIVIEISEEYDSASAGSTAVFYPEQLVIFKDAPLRITMKPIYHTIKTTLAVKYISQDRFTASNWLRTIRNRAVRDANNPRIFGADYHYPIPMEFMVILLKLHAMREGVGGYGDSLGEWFHQCFTPKMTVLANVAGKGSTYAIRENQIGIMGMFSFEDQPPSTEAEDKGGPYTSSFDYTVYYDRPESVAIRYPLMIHNQLVEPMLRAVQKPTYFDTVPQENSLSYDLFSRFTSHRDGGLPYSGYPGLPIPHFDDWLPNPVTFKKGFRNSVRFMVQIDPMNPRDLLSLTQLGEWVLKPDVLDYMQKDPSAMLVPYESLFHIELHAGDLLVSNDLLTISPELDIRTTFDLDLRTNYHLILHVLVDFSRLPPARVNETHGNTVTVVSVIKTNGGNPVLVKPGGAIKTAPEIIREWVRTVNVYVDNISPTTIPGKVKPNVPKDAPLEVLIGPVEPGKHPGHNTLYGGIHAHRRT